MSNQQRKAWEAPSLPQAEPDRDNPGHQFLSIARLYDISGETLTCQVPISAGMLAGDIVRVRGRFGEVIYDAPEVAIANPPRPLTVAMPKFMLYGVAGNVMDLNFALRKPGSDWQISQSRNIRVESQALTLQRPSLPKGSHTLQIDYLGMKTGDKVHARLYSSPTSFVQPDDVTVTRIAPVPIEIYHSWFEANRDKRVWLNYSVWRNGQPRWLISQVLYIERLEVPSQ
ncbi:hypothetical protein KMS_R14780 [Pseudomonas sp. LRP2-20]|uniref:hypothetical protein n=1 Tax=Pseudomonas sp. LRP2-20 TaxID=2944234 RepID=UPI00218ABB91|nr:hypothetical protein [Pseudomonas sp. LRP2-20]BDM21720.1 hypothetical protein KMS_R14780 [Pseudomonas sp. LRP2-20]